MKAEIIATGTEILLGQTLNTSAHYITGKLSELGIEVDYHTTVGDNKERLKYIISQGLQRSNLLVITGGTGPTKDDLSKELVAEILGLEMVLDQNSLDRIEEFFTQRGTKMPQKEIKQAYFPQGAVILPNHNGTAPGAILQKEDQSIILLPGPPSEMELIFQEYVLPFLEGKVPYDSTRMNVRVIKVIGFSEAELEEKLSDLLNLSEPSMTLLSKHSEMHIRMISRGNDQKKAHELLDQTEEIIRGILGDKVYGTDEDTLVGLVSESLKKNGLTLATAESCTGGMLGEVLTQVPGSSEYYLGGVISYSNDLKAGFLGVQCETLEKFGAVSEKTAMEMAVGIRDKAKADLGVSITGIAGPDGGSQEKPVGLVYIGLATRRGVEAHKFQFHGNRDSIRQLSVQAALDWIRRYMSKFERG